MSFIMSLVFTAIFFLILYAVIKAAVRHGIEDSHTHRIIQEYFDATVPDHADRKPVDEETFNRIHGFSKQQNIPIQEILHTPFEEIYLIKTETEHFFVHVGERVTLIEQDDVKEEWNQWKERM